MVFMHRESLGQMRRLSTRMLLEGDSACDTDAESSLCDSNGTTSPTLLPPQWPPVLKRKRPFQLVAQEELEADQDD